MKSTISILAGLLVCSVFALAQPKIEIVGGRTYDWGTVPPPPSGNLVGKIRIKNIGTDVLKLTEIKPGCGCTKTDPDKTELKPGEVSTMGVTLNITNTQSGDISKSIVVKSTSANDDSVLVIILKTNINRLVRIEPSPYFAFAGAKVGQPATAKLNIVNADKVDLVLSDFKTDAGLTLNVRDKKVVKPGEKFELILTTTPSKKGSITGAVTLKTSNQENPDITLTAYGNAEE